MALRSSVFACAAIAVLVGSWLSVPPATAVEPGSTVSVSQLLDELVVSAPSSTAYDRALFEEGIDVDNDGCNTRREVLQQEATVAPETGEGCALTGGQWMSWYDGVVWYDESSLEMDHLVALKEAWVSGAYAWTNLQRSAYANDLDIPETLNAITASVNGEKAAKDPAGWLPSDVTQRCRFVADVVVVKYRWNLSVDTAEKSAIADVLAECPGVSVESPPLPADRPSAPAVIPDTAYVITAHDGWIYAVTSTSFVALTYGQWQGLGFPAPSPAVTAYHKNGPYPSIYATTTFGPAMTLTSVLTYDQWRRAGFPAPRADWSGWTFYQWAGSPQIFGQDSTGGKRVLTPSDWASSGYATFVKRTSQGFVKLSWDTRIAFLDDFTNFRGQSAVDYGRWAAEGFPQPLVAARFPGDIVYKNYNNSTIWYAGPTVNRPITYPEWAAMGFPPPQVQGSPPPPAVPPRPARDKDCRDFPSRAAAQAEFNALYPYYGDVYRLDADGDMVVCESYFG